MVKDPRDVDKAVPLQHDKTPNGKGSESSGGIRRPKKSGGS